MHSKTETAVGTDSDSDSESDGLKQWSGVSGVLLVEQIVT